jgi:hypothetical protein
VYVGANITADNTFDNTVDIAYDDIAFAITAGITVDNTFDITFDTTFTNAVAITYEINDDTTFAITSDITPDIATDISDNETFLMLDISANNLCAEGGKALAAGLKGNNVITELNMASNYLGITPDGDSDMSGVIAVGDAISDMGALSKLIFGGSDKYIGDGQMCYNTPEPATLELGMTEVDLSNKGLQTAGAIIIAAWISHRDKGVLSVLSLKSNALLNIESGKTLAHALKGNSVLTELDVSANYDPQNANSRDGPGFAQELAVGIKDNGTLTKFDISNNSLYAAGGKALAEGLKDNQVITELNIASNHLGCKTHYDSDGADMSGVVALADVIPDMGALLVLSLRNNKLFAAGGKALAEGLKGNQVITELNIASNHLGCKTHYDSDGADISGIIALADVIPVMGALLSLNLAKNCLCGIDEAGNGKHNTSGDM